MVAIIFAFPFLNLFSQTLAGTTLGNNHLFFTFGFLRESYWFYASTACSSQEVYTKGNLLDLFYKKSSHRKFFMAFAPDRLLLEVKIYVFKIFMNI